MLLLYFSMGGGRWGGGLVGASENQSKSVLKTCTRIETKSQLATLVFVLQRAIQGLSVGQKSHFGATIT